MYDMGVVVAADDKHGDLYFKKHVDAFKRAAEHWPTDIKVHLELVDYADQPYDAFSKGIAVNAGIRKLQNKCKVIACTDIDIMVPPIAIRDAYDFHNSNPGNNQLLCQLSRDLFQWDGTIEFDENGDWADPEYKMHPIRFRCIGSWLSMAAEHWFRCGGFSEEYKGWGSDDHEVKERAALHGIDFVDKSTNLMHLAHPQRNYNGDDNRARNDGIRYDPARKLRNFLAETRKPDFIIAGAQKSATCTLSFNLEKHPEIYMPKMKPFPFEIHHFDKEELYSRGDDFYFSWFPKWFPQSMSIPKIVGEKTPNYMQDVETVERMHKTTPDSKIILILRDPIDRAYSALNHVYSVRAKWEGVSVQFGNRLDNELHRQIVDRWDDNPFFTFGEYYEPVKRIKELFKDVLVLRYSDFAADPTHTMGKVATFLGVSPFLPEDVITRKCNAHGYELPMREDDREFLQKHYARSNEKLFDLLDWDSF